MIPARLVLPALRWRPETGFAHEEPAIEHALELGVGGFIVFGGPGARRDEIAALTARLARLAGRPLLVGADLERGAGQQARGATECPPPRALAALGDPAVIRWAGAVTGREARELGVNWVFAPVADLDLDPANPIVQTRAFGDDPDRTGAAVAEWVRSCQAEGVMACAKHYPGHGRTTADSHERLPRVAADAATLRRSDLVPFRAAIAAGVGSIMTAHVAYPALDPAGCPATLSPPILDQLRQELGFQGLIVTDALVMEGVRGGRSEREVAPEAVAAGCDLLLYPRDLDGAVEGLRHAMADGRLSEDRLTEALARGAAALAALQEPRVPPPPAAPALAAASVAARLLAAGLLRGVPPRLDRGFRFVIVDDDQTGWYPPGPNDLVPRTLARRGIHERWEGARIVLAFASPRAGRDRAGFGPASQAELARQAPGAGLVVLFGHPRLVAEIPGDAPVLCAWHRQELMQRAVADWLAERAR
jgi:beta-glucosidase